MYWQILKPAEKKKPNGSRPVTPPRNMVTKQAKKWGDGWETNGQRLTPLVCFRPLHLKDSLFFILQYWKNIHSYSMKAKYFIVLFTGVNWYVTVKNLRCFALHFAASLCHIWLFNQEKPNNTATYAQECLVWSCAQFLHFLLCLIGHFIFTVCNCNLQMKKYKESHMHWFTSVKVIYS